MGTLDGIGMAFVVLVVTLMIGAALVVLTYNQVFNVSGNDSSLTTIKTDGISALTTLVSFLAVLAIAAVGGIALYFVRGMGSGGSGI